MTEKEALENAHACHEFKGVFLSSLLHAVPLNSILGICFFVDYETDYKNEDWVHKLEKYVVPNPVQGYVTDRSYLLTEECVELLCHNIDYIHSYWTHYIITYEGVYYVIVFDSDLFTIRKDVKLDSDLLSRCEEYEIHVYQKDEKISL